MQGLAIHAIGAGKVNKRLVGVGAVAVTVTQGMGSLVADVCNCQRKGRRDGALYAQVPGIDCREVERDRACTRTDLRARVGQQTAGRYRDRCIGFRPNTQIECRGLVARSIDLLVGQDRKVLGDGVTEDGSEDARIEAASVTCTNDRFSST